MAIAHYARDDGKGASPGVPTIARDCGLRSTRSVQKALDKARAAGELEIIYNYGPSGTNLYRVRLENLGCAAPARSRRSAAPAKSAGSIPPAKSADEGSVFKGSQYSSKARRQNQPVRDSPDAFAERASANGYLTCPDCGRYGEKCNCDSEFQAGFDRAMRAALDAGRPAPAQLSSGEALRRAYFQEQ